MFRLCAVLLEGMYVFSLVVGWSGFREHAMLCLVKYAFRRNVLIDISV